MTRYELILQRRAERRAKRDARHGVVPDLQPQAVVPPTAQEQLVAGAELKVEPVSYDDLSLVELRDTLSSRELPTSGNKPDLVERLSAADEADTVDPH